MSMRACVVYVRRVVAYFIDLVKKLMNCRRECSGGVGLKAEGVAWPDGFGNKLSGKWKAGHETSGRWGAGRR